MKPFNPTGWQRFEKVLAQVPQGVKCAVAVSGGLDSVVLLDLLRSFLDRPLVVLHLNHQLRGDASNADADFVSELALAAGCDMECRTMDVAAMAEEVSCSLETAGRMARREFFHEVCADCGIGHVWLGHHADDQAETLLWNLLRGAGVEGLSGMSECTAMQVGGPVLMRPMLGFWRTEISSYAEERGLQFCEDASNADPAFMRNRLRHWLIPQIEEVLGRPVKQNLVQAAEILSAENALVRDATNAAFPEMQAELQVYELTKWPLAIQRRMLQRWLEYCGIPGCGFREIEAVRGLLQVRDGGSAKVNLPGDHHARRRSGLLFVE